MGVPAQFSNLGGTSAIFQSYLVVTLVWLPCLSSLERFQHMFSWRWLKITFSIIGPCERGDAYSEAKSISELCALAHSSVASQYITRFPVAVPTCRCIWLKSSYWIPLYGCGLGAGESGSADEVRASEAKL